MLKDIDWVKAGLLAGMAICVLLLLRQWDSPDANPTPSGETLLTGSPASAPNPLNITEENPLSVPAPASSGLAVEASVGNELLQNLSANSSYLISIDTDVLNLVVDLNGGDFIQADLIDYHVALDDDTAFRILDRTAQHNYVAKSGLLLSSDGNNFAPAKTSYQATSSSYSLSEGQEELVIELTSQQDGYDLTKRLRLKRGTYLIQVEHEITNNSDNLLRGAFFAQIDRDDLKPPTAAGPGMKPYVGAAITTPDDRYKKLDFGDLEDQRFSESVDTGWVALLQHYFVSAWIPVADQSLSYELGKYNTQDLYYIGFTQPAFDIAPGSTSSLSAGLYIGPKDQYELEGIAEHLNLTVDYKFLWWAAQPLFWLLQKIHSFVGNWGVAIILLTCLVKLVFYPLSAASYKSMARMKKLAPKMQALKERHGSDRQALSQETMKLYQKEKVNPLGGCLPILIQMPIFMALYWVLMESVEIRHAPFFGWIQDLSSKDPWYLLPIIMGVSMVVQQRLNPAPPDPMQAKVMQFMPIMFAVMMAFFPAGLVLYWTVNNLLSIAQQWVITRRIEAAD